MLGQLNRTGFSKRTRRYLQGSFKLSHDLDFITKGLSVAAQFSYDTFNQHTINNSVPTHSMGNLTYPGYSTWMLPTEYSIDEWKNNADYWIKNGTYVTANQRTTDDAQRNSISHGSPEGTSRFQARLDYARKFGDHNVSGMLLFSCRTRSSATRFPIATWDFRAARPTTTGTSTSSSSTSVTTARRTSPAESATAYSRQVLSAGSSRRSDS